MFVWFRGKRKEKERKKIKSNGATYDHVRYVDNIAGNSNIIIAENKTLENMNFEEPSLRRRSDKRERERERE